MPSDKIRVEDTYKPSTKSLQAIGDFYTDFYNFKNQRSGEFRQLQHTSLEDFWVQSRTLFWNSMITKSEDLEALGLDFSLPFVRKEVMDFTGRVVALGISPQLQGEGMGMYGVQVLQSMYKKWRLHSKDKVEKFWQLLYGSMNGTLCTYVGFDMGMRDLNYLTDYDSESGDFKLDNKKKALWNDAFTEIVPLEEIYLEKIYERKVQNQNKTIRRQQMTKAQFDYNFPKSKYPRAEFVQEGNKISEDSLFFQLLGGSGVCTTDKIEVLTGFTLGPDEKKVLANGIWIDELGKGKARPNPFTHKGQPYVWSQNEAIDDKFAYGMSMPFKLKGSVKILNTSYTMLVERELRDIDPPIITSDFEAPELIFGQKRVIPVNDVNAYKEFQLKEASGAYFTMMNSLQGVMSSFAQGGFSQVAPSRQPRSAKELMDIEKMKQDSLGNTLIMYYDLLHQEMFLLLKTMLQFYHAGKYANIDENLVRSFTLPNSNLSQGGVGDLEVRFVQKPQEGLELYFEAVHKSIENGKTTEILEVPIDLITYLEWYVDDIKLEPEKSSDQERAAWNEQVLQPLLNVFIPGGVASMSKTYLRFLEKNNEHPSSFTDDQNMGKVMTSWAPDQNTPTGRENIGAATGNVNQINTGIKFGSQNNESKLQE